MDFVDIGYSYTDMDSVEVARTPVRFIQRVAAQFQSSENVQYLRELFIQRLPPSRLLTNILDTLWDAVDNFVTVEILESDPTTRRGAATSHWAEIRRLNRAFYQQRITAFNMSADSYQMRAFENDSLHPAGLEHLNSGPTYQPIFGPDDDEAWDDGDPDRTTDQAIAQFCSLGVGEPTSTRLMRYERPPVWQRTGDRHHEIALDALSDGFESQVRRWEPLQPKRKQKTARSAHMI